MTLIVQDGYLITKSGRLATDLGCCCSTCCCTGNLPPTSTVFSDYTGTSLLRRIVNPATPSCTGKGISGRLSKDLAGTQACDPISIVVEWCGLTLTQGNETSANLNSTSRAEPFESFLHPTYGRLFKQGVTLSFSSFIFTPGLPHPFLNVCGRCVFRLLLITNINTYPNPTTGTAYKVYFLDWRESCDEYINIMLYEIKDLFSNPSGPDATFALPYCNDPPVVTLIFAP
jgi:hypothetical protein